MRTCFPTVLVLLGLGLSIAAPSIAAGPECQTAAAACDKAQQMLSKAMRDADTRADAYVTCTQRSGACAALKTAYDAALAAKTRAAAALKAALSRRQLACN
jgi:hypothetical protein